MNNTLNLTIESIIVDMTMQPRVDGLNEDHLCDLEEAYRNGEKMPPITVWQVGDEYRLADGFHRIEAARRAGQVSIRSIVKQGSEKDWIVDCASSNKHHGLRRTNADKRKAVTMLIAALPDSSSRSIAKLAGVSHTFVENIRLGPDKNSTELGRGKNSIDATAEPDQQGGNRCHLDGHQNVDVADVFCQVVADLCRELDVVIGKLNGLSKSRFSACVLLGTAIAQLRAARKQLWLNRPLYECLYCSGAGGDCRACGGTGRLRKDRYLAARESLGL